MKDKKRIPIGIDNFNEIINYNYYYVDKTKMIEELIINRSKVSLFPRPRRFGKTLMLSTIDEFFNIEKAKENEKLFEGLYISKSKYANMQGKYPVIRINFKKVQSLTWEALYERIEIIMQELYRKFIYIQEKLEKTERDFFQAILNKSASQGEEEQALSELSKYLERYYNQKVILLIDEYDVPVQCGVENSFYEEVISFIKNLFGNALEINNVVEMAIITGILKANISDLSGTGEKNYNEYYGFTVEETKKMLKYFNLELTTKVKRMYDGYKFNGLEIYNPWSIINYCSKKVIDNFWINTSSNGLIKQVLNNTENIVPVLRELMGGETRECIYNEKLTFLDLKNQIDTDTALNFLVLTGYLSVEKIDYTEYGRMIQVKIPNMEVQSIYNEIVRDWLVDNSAVSPTELIYLKREMEK